MNFERLRTLWLVSQVGTLAAAAQRLGVTPSAVSQQLGVLEGAVGADLLQAEGRGVVLTDLGFRLAQLGGELVATLEAAKAVAEEAGADTTGRFRISSIPTAALSLVRHAILALQNEHPKLELSVIDQDPLTSLRQLQSHAVDLAVIEVFDGQPWTIPDGLQATSLGRDAMQLFVPSTMKLPAGPVELGELADANWISSPAFTSYAGAVRAACTTAGFEPRVRWETDDIFLMQRYVADGFGVALHPPFSADPPPEGVVIREVAGEPICREILVIARSSSTARPVHKVVMRALTSNTDEQH